MKKLFFLGLFAAALVISCNNDETIDSVKSTKAIQFESFVNKSVRSTVDVTTTNLAEFQVWGLMNKGDQTGTPFAGTIVNKSNDVWSYTPPVYWEVGYNYSFTAIAPKGINFTAPTVVGKFGSISFDNGIGTTDLLYATNTTPTVVAGSEPAEVALTFNHLLSRVKFAFTNGMDDGSTINVTAITITNASKNASIDLDAESISWSSNETEKLTFGNVSDEFFGNGIEKATDHKYMIPVNKGTDEDPYEVTFTITRNHNGVTDVYARTATLPEPTDGWQPGYSYLFKATYDATSLKPIIFTATVEDWKDFGENKITL